MRIAPAVLTLSLALGPMLLHAVELERQSLFKIERSKNANIIQYDAQMGSDGKLYKKVPVVAYWVRLAEQGQVKKLSWVQRVFAYGFSTDYDEVSDSATLDMAADLGQSIDVRRLDGKYRAVIEIDNKPSELVKIFIQSHRKGITVKVDYIEIYGTDLETGQDSYVRFVP